MQPTLTQEDIRARFTESNIQKRFKGLVDIGEKPGREAAQKRGQDFEALLLDLFHAHGLLVRRSYFTADNSSEQIDGAITISGRIALVEAKWVESGLAASELFAFLGKVEGKFIGTIGVFVSYVELSSNFISALRAGRRQSILVVHGDADVAQAFRPDFPLREYLEECVNHVSIDNVPHLPTASFISDRQRAKRADTANKKEDLRTLLDKLAAPGASASGLALIGNPAQIEQNLRDLLDFFPKVLTRPSPEPLRSQILNYVDAGLNRLDKSELNFDRAIFENVFPITILDPGYLPLLIVLADKRLQFVSNETRALVNDILISTWEKNLGTYEKENTLATLTRSLWPYLSSESKRRLIGWFVHFVNSSRRLYFPQMQLAREKVADNSEAELRNEVLHDLIKAEFVNMLDSGVDPTWAQKWVNHSFKSTMQLVPEAKAIVDSVQDELAKAGKLPVTTSIGLEVDSTAIQ